MKHLIRLTDLTAEEVQRIFDIADELRQGKHRNFLKGRTVILFFPETSLRTRVTFEKGVHLLGGQAILFPQETLEKGEDIRDVCGYLSNWADAVVVRHKNIGLLETMAAHSAAPVINAMTDVNHPCEVLSDLYALSKRRREYQQDRYLFVGKKGNIALAWREAAQVLGLQVEQCCAAGDEIDGMRCHHDLLSAMEGKDVICTDAIPQADAEAYRAYQVTAAAMRRANPGAVLNPCPPFYRGREVSEDAIDSPGFVGYDFKKHLLEVQQAVIIHCLSNHKRSIFAPVRAEFA